MTWNHMEFEEMKYSTMPSFQQHLMSELVSGNIIPKYWGVFFIKDRFNGAECVTRTHMILRGSMTCGKVQDQRDVPVMIRAILVKYAMPELLFQLK